MNEKHRPHTSKDEQIGYHKGAINTLIGERNELIRLIQITDSFIQAHARELEKLGVRLESSQQSQNNSAKP